MAGLLLEGVGKTWPDGTEAVRDVDFEAADGEFVVLVGPSGCGKSTTLRMIAGLESVSRGRILLGGRDVTSLPARERNLAMVFQSYALYPHLSVAENLAFGLRPRLRHRSILRGFWDAAWRRARRREQEDLRRRVLEAARLLELEGLLERRPRELSGGQRQRVALGRAIVRDPAAFLFDEPLSNLDARLRLEMRAEIKALQRRLGVTSLWVTHDQEEAMTLGDRLVVMRDGRLQQIGAAREIYEAPVNRFVAGFVGSPPMNFLAGTLRGGDGGLVFETAGASLPLRGEPPQALPPVLPARGVLGVRPDRWRLQAPGEPGLPARIRVVEHLGDRMDRVLEGPGGLRLVARSETGPGGGEGEAVSLGLREGAWHWFPPEEDEAGDAS